jgi:hypothetical protein
MLDLGRNVKVMSSKVTDGVLTDVGCERLGNREKHRTSVLPVADVASSKLFFQKLIGLAGRKRRFQAR